MSQKDRTSGSLTSGGEHVAAAGPLSVVYRKVQDLRPNPRNPRSHTRKQISQIAKSIETFNFNVPVLVDAELNVIAGHGRILAAQKLGMAAVPTISLAHLTPAQAKAFLIADNRLTEISEWDDKLLAEQFIELSALDLNFDIDITGFELAEIDFRIQSLNEVDAQADDPADEMPATVSRAIARVGDVWQLNDHRVVCGNALDASTYEVLLDGAKADLVFTDPPYNVAIQGHVSGNGAVQHREFAMASGEMTKAQFTGFLAKTVKHLVAYSRSGSVHYVCIDWRHAGELLTAGEGAYTDLLNLCVWTKHNGGMGSLYRSQHELVFVYKVGTAPHLNNVQLGKFGRNRSNVWSYPGINNFGRGTEEGKLLEMHPTVKPTALVADAVLDCSNRGDLVLDAFLGSGTTLMACERTGRCCCGIEIDPVYVDTAIRRWQKFTGGQAVCIGDGCSFAEREREAANG